MDINEPGQTFVTQGDLSNLSYEQRWEFLRPTITQIYLGEKLSIQALADRMKSQYGFSAL